MLQPTDREKLSNEKGCVCVGGGGVVHESRCEGELKWILPVDRGRELKRVSMGTGGIRYGEDERREYWEKQLESGGILG